MRTRCAAAAAVLILAVAAAATAGAHGPATVLTRTDPALGTYLTDATGMTLYRYAKDTTQGRSRCTGRCAQNWPPFSASPPLTLPDGVPGTLTSFARSDGVVQIAYDGIPLYRFARDRKPGDTKGQGSGGVWTVVAPGAQFGTLAASPIASPATAPRAEAAVAIVGYAYDPPQLTVAAGTTVLWTNQDDVAHTVTADDGSFDSGQMGQGKPATLSRTFTEPGTYTYHCIYHLNMTATIVVT